MIDDKENKKTECSVLCPTNPYAATKAGAELIAQSYYYSFKMPIIITRGNNVYGPNQYPEKLIPRFIQQLKNNEKVTIQGDGSALRCFMHVEDFVDAVELVIARGENKEIYNVATNEEHSVLDVTKMICDEMGVKLEDNVRYIEDRLFQDPRYNTQNDKILRLGWKPSHTLKKTLPSIIKWYSGDDNFFKQQ